MAFLNTFLMRVVCNNVVCWQRGALFATYTALYYRVFLLDYRGYGKSGGTITNQVQLLADVDTVYRTVSRGPARGD